MKHSFVCVALVLMFGCVTFAESPLDLRDACKNGLKALELTESPGTPVKQQSSMLTDTGHCIGYINAVADSLEYIGGMCLPAGGVSNRTFAEQYIGFAEHYPGHFDLAYPMVRLMLQERYPCKK